MLNDIFGLYLWLAFYFCWTALVYMILLSLLEQFRYYQLGCYHVQVTVTSTQRGVNNKECIVSQRKQSEAEKNQVY